MLYSILFTLGMIAVGILVWRLLQRQEQREGDRTDNGAGDSNSDGKWF
jgi:hypothetical protein